MARPSRKPKSKRAGLWGVGLVCVLLVGFGLYTLARALQALDEATLVPGGPRYGPMSGTTAIIMGLCSILAGAFGLWLILRGSRRI